MDRSVRYMGLLRSQGRPVMELVRLRKHGRPGFKDIVHLLPDGRPGLALCGAKTTIYDRVVEDIAESPWTRCKRCEKLEAKDA